MLQLFAEMLEAAEAVADETFNELEGLAALHEMLSEQSSLWRRFQMKEARFRAPDGDPLHANMWPAEASVLNPAMVFDTHSHRGQLH